MGAIVNIFKAIFGGIFGLFSKGKNGFYMEAPPVEAGAAVAVPAAAVAPAAVASPTNGTVAKKGKASASKGKASAKGEVKPAAAPQKVVSDPIDLINAALAASKAAAEEAAVAAGGFADKYMMPLPTPTRRPGANMAMYKSMAKDMKRF
jgi:hypothetical protein